MRTCLEIRSMDERHIEEMRNDYNRFDQYNLDHSDARATGDAQGKGTGNYSDGADIYTQPFFSPEPTPIDYSRFDTDYDLHRYLIDTNPGNGTDNKVRNDMIRRNKYWKIMQYCPSGVFEEYKLYEGQDYWHKKPIFDTHTNTQQQSSQNTIYFGHRD